MDITIKCYNCKKLDIINDVKYNIPGGIRGNGPSQTIHFCSQECLNKFKKTDQCQVCKCIEYDKYIIDDIVVCSDDSSYMTRPTCREQYTNKIKCDFCDLIKIGNIYKIDNDEIEKTLLLCQDCYDKYDTKYNKWCIIEKKFNVKKIEIDHSNYQKILYDYNIKKNALNIDNIKKFIIKIKNEKEDEFNELYDFVNKLK
jgi:hypothetical protein